MRDQNDRVLGAVGMGGPAASLEDTWDCPFTLLILRAAALSNIVTSCLVSESESASTQNHRPDKGKGQRERSVPIRATSQLIPPGQVCTMHRHHVAACGPQPVSQETGLTRPFRERLLDSVCLVSKHRTETFLKILIIAVE